MSLNGVSNYGYSNPYAVNNAYSQPSFQAATTPVFATEEAQPEKKSNTGKVLLGLGAAAAAIGTTIYAFKKGKAANLAKGAADASIWKNIGEGFKGIKDSAVKGFNKIFKETKDVVSKGATTAAEATKTTAKVATEAPIQTPIGKVYKELGTTQTLREFRNLGKGG